MSIGFTMDADGIVVLTIDMPGRSANVLNDEFWAAFADALDRLAREETLTGVILTSGKKLFVVGADIDAVFVGDDPRLYFDGAQTAKTAFRRLELLGKPVVAALNGTALGGGFELALACHHRIALDNPRTRFGFPEVGLGLLPGAGGVTRTVRMLGLQAALEVLAQGKQVDPQAALAAGLVDEVVADRPALLERARAWIAAHPAPEQPWDRQGFKIPGGGPDNPRIAQLLAIAPAVMRRETRGNYPAPHAIMAAAVEGAQVDFETACRIESRYFARLASGRVARNLITVNWTHLNEIKKGASRPQTVPRQRTQKVGILGAGLMGHGIAYVSAYAGLEVVLKDVSMEKAQAGKERIGAILARRVKRGRMDDAQMAAVLGRVQPTGDAGELNGCDLIIEAVFEDRALKAAVTAEAEAVMDPNGVFASNTSTLPITGLAGAAQRPVQFIGLHFFSPVDRMKLVEIIVGELTSDLTLARAFDFVLQINKIPIVVNDSRGFYTSRVFMTWVYEGLALLAEGYSAQSVEAAGMQAGMPLGPLALLDELSLGLVNHIRQQTRRDLAAEGRDALTHPGDAVIDRMVALGRLGRAGGAGFYAYPAEGEKRLWPELAEIFGSRSEDDIADQVEMVERLLFVQSLEAVRCLDENVIRSVADANVGSVYGWGFAPHQGGTLQYINSYGLPAFVARADELNERYGVRFAPPPALVRMAAAGETFA